MVQRKNKWLAWADLRAFFKKDSSIREILSYKLYGVILENGAENFGKLHKFSADLRADSFIKGQHIQGDLITAPFK